MAKKYLLYIHNDKFDEEPQKSSLINLLLDRHYDFYRPGTLIEEIEPEDLDESVVGNKELADRLSPVRTPEEALDKAKELIKDDTRTCKVHGTALDWRGKCLQKDCKYS